MTTPKISVVVCTYNRAKLLDCALRTLCAQTLARDAYEIIVVDNNSTDHTATVAAAYPQVRYVMEPRQGVSHARNRGLQEARGAFIGYVDDECAIPEGWLVVANDIIQRIDPDVFGGPYFSFYDGSAPCWFKDEYGSHEPFPDARALQPSEYRQLYGGNVFFRRALIEELGGFDPEFGMTGSALGYGEETDLLDRLARQTPPARACYDPKLWVRHMVRNEKLRLTWWVRAHFANGRAQYRMISATKNGHALGTTVRRAVGLIARLTFDSARGALRRNRQWYPYYQNYFLECVARHFYTLGQLYESAREHRTS
jgi:glucosyl-dolichyl phosphate glucuronosyltransferase